MSGEESEGEGGGAGVRGCWGMVKGGWERRRTASVMVGWKGPPWGEWARRWVGRVWPRVKKVDANLGRDVRSDGLKGGKEGRGRGTCL